MKMRISLRLLVMSFLVTAGILMWTGVAYENSNGAVIPISAEVPLTDTSNLPSSAHPLETIYVPSDAVRFNTDTTVDTKDIVTNSYGWVNWSTDADGYITVSYTADTDKRIKCTVTGPNMKYVYDVTPDEPTTLSLSEGSGNYTVCLLENTTGNSYKVKTKAEFTACVDGEFAPFLVSNPYTDWADAELATALAEELTRDETTTLGKIDAIYDWVVSNLKYDRQKAATVPAGYLPDLDDTVETKKGICFDYASLTAGMLRSQGIPCKLVIGYAGDAYHAWISVYSDETGWLENTIHFSGDDWERLDPTFASTGKSSAYIMSYIGDGENYKAERWY